jgi:putative transposase
VQIDHTPVDVIIVDEIYRLPIGRPYLTVAIDVYSRCIAGFCLSLEAPSATTVGLCLVHMVFPKDNWLAERKIKTTWQIWGKPDGLYVDNATEFHSVALQRGCEAHGIKLDYRPLGQPHFGGIVERVIGTMMDLIHRLPGTTFSNVKERENYPSEKKALHVFIPCCLKQSIHRGYIVWPQLTGCLYQNGLKQFFMKKCLMTIP